MLLVWTILTLTFSLVYRYRSSWTPTRTPTRCLRPSERTLEAQKALLLLRTLAPSTCNTYQVGIKQYLAFCLHNQVSPLPLSEVVIENFCVSWYARISYKSIKVYLCGVQFWSKLNGGRELIEQMPRLEYVLKAIRRAQGNSFNRPARPPSLGICFAKYAPSFIIRNPPLTATC